MAEPLFAIVGAFGAAHLWDPCEPPHAALRSQSYVRSRCGQVARTEDLLTVLHSDAHRCKKCLAQVRVVEPKA